MATADKSGEAISVSGLRKTVRLAYIWALASATILGPWLVMAQWWYSLTGPSLSLAFAITALLMIPVALCYSEMTSMLPYAGGSYNFIGHSFGSSVSFIFMWSQAICYYAVIAFNILATIWILQYAGIIPSEEGALILAGVGFAVLYAVINFFKVELSAAIQFGLFWLLFITGLVWNGFDLLLSPKFSLAYFSDYMPNGIEGFMVAAGVMVTMYFGFETVAHMSEESKFPTKKIYLPVVGSILTAGLVYLVTLTAMAGVAPYEYLVETANVPAEIIYFVNGPTLWAQIGWVGIVLGGLACALTCVDGFWLALSRLYFALGDANLFPRFFGRLNKYRVPHIANFFVFLGVVPCIVFSGSYWIATLFVIMGLAIAVVYLGSTLSFIKLRLSHPEWKRPYKAPLGLLVGALGVFGSGFCVYWSIMAMTIDGWYLMISYILIGVVFYFAMRYHRKNKGLEVKLMPPVE